jgi:uncharacterized protein YybS (DUF2232 family)
MPQARQAMQELIQMFIAVFPGMLIISLMVTIVVAGLWAQFVLLSNKMALRPLPVLNDFDLPPWLLLVLVLLALMSMVFSGPIAYFARNSLMPLALPYFFVGTSLMHLWCAKRKNPRLMLVIYYLLVIGSGWPALLVAILGVFEPWLKLRQRIDPKPNSG